MAEQAAHLDVAPYTPDTELADESVVNALAFAPFTDTGNAERLVALEGKDRAHVPGVGWFAWMGM